MGAGQRRKGSQFENDTAKQLAVVLGVEVKRHLGQAREGGEDIRVAGWAIECKRRARLATVEGWLAQAQAAACRHDPPSTPLVVMRADRGEAMALLRFSDLLTLLAPSPRPPQQGQPNNEGEGG